MVSCDWVRWVTLPLLLGCVCACGSAEDEMGRVGGPGTGGLDATGGAVGGGGSTFDNGGAATMGTGGATMGTGGATMGTGGSTADGCSSVEEAAEPLRGAVDIIWVIDNSGSMSEEMDAVRNNINAFANEISMAGVDHHVIMITSEDLAAGTALGNDPAHYLYRPVSVGSHNPLQILLDDYPNYSSFLRPNAPTHFVVVTDDESTVLADTFQPMMEGLLGHGFYLHAIASEDIGAGEPCGNVDCVDIFVGMICNGGAAAPGYQYYDLAARTGGQAISICLPDWSQVFGPLQDAVIESVPLPCDFPIPAPPSGETLDPNLVNVNYTPPNADVSIFPRADAEGQCADLLAWYYDDPDAPTTVKLCPTACTTVAAGGSIKIAFGCEAVLLQ